MRTVPLRLLCITCVSRVASRGRSSLRSWSSSSSKTFYVGGCAEKREKKDAIWPNGTWYSLLMKPPWREKWVLKVYNIKFPDSLDAQSNSACASEPPWPPTFFITPSIPRATTISLQLQWSPLGGPFWSIFIQLEANFPRPVFSAFFKVTLDK